MLQNLSWQEENLLAEICTAWTFQDWKQVEHDEDFIIAGIGANSFVLQLLPISTVSLAVISRVYCIQIEAR